jgi:hypothetical protein
MGNGGKGRIKKNEKIRGQLGTKIDIATVPQQWRQKSLLGFLATQEINPQVHGYRCSFHLRVFHEYRIQGNMCVLTSYSRSKDTS